MDIARANQSEIILLHVFRPPAREYANIIALAGQESQIDVVREQTKQYLIGLRTELRDEGIECRVQMIEGASAAHLIVDYINGEEVDLVVMSTRGHTGLARMVFGSVANTVMQSVRVPCMLIYPDDETSENNSNG